jgi:hypothetical protein
MKPNIIRIKENKYYILYKRIKDRGDTIPLYVVYYTDDFGGGISEQFSTRQSALRFFNKATKEAIAYNKDLTGENYYD